MELVKANIDGMNLAYARRGTGAPLVLIHGYPLDHSTWDEVAPLLEHDFDLIIPDLRGFGASDVLETDDSILTYASDIAGLLTHLQVQKAYITGHSMGGYVALAFARLYEERVRGLGLVGSQMAADSPERKQGRYASAAEVLEKGSGVVADSMSPKLSADAFVQHFVHELIGKQAPRGLATALRAMAERPDSTELFPGFPFPVVVVHGDADALIPVERGREMKQALPAAHYAELPGAGHMAMMEQPKAVAEALQAFGMVKVKSGQNEA